MVQDRRYIKEHYPGVIKALMAARGITPASIRPDPSIPENASFSDIARYTHWYVAGGGTGQQPHYRYDRYMNFVRDMGDMLYPKRRLTHVDIGCGPGRFSWVLLDWATYQGIGWDRLALYGFDHCPAMILLAKYIRSKLAIRINNLPMMNFRDDTDTLLQRLTEGHSNDTDYVITFGHVLVQAQSPPNIETFALIIAEVMELIEHPASCTLLAYDANSGGLYQEFYRGWGLLLAELRALGINHQLVFQSPSARAAATLHRGTNITTPHDNFPHIDDVDDLPF